MSSDRDGIRGGWATPGDDQPDAESASEMTGEFTIDYAPPAWYTQNASEGAGGGGGGAGGGPGAGEPGTGASGAAGSGATASGAGGAPGAADAAAGRSGAAPGAPSAAGSPSDFSISSLPGLTPPAHSMPKPPSSGGPASTPAPAPGAPFTPPPPAPGAPFTPLLRRPRRGLPTHRRRLPRRVRRTRRPDRPDRRAVVRGRCPSFRWAAGSSLSRPATRRHPPPCRTFLLVGSRPSGELRPHRPSRRWLLRQLRRLPFPGRSPGRSPGTAIWRAAPPCGSPPSL